MPKFTRRLAISRQRSRLARWTTASSIHRTIRAVWNARHTAAVARAGRTFAAWTRTSFLYRWLTAEPEPDIIVIDLRDTYTVGPFIALLDRVTSALRPSYRRSKLRSLGERLDQTASRIADTRAGRLLAAILTPPEHPDESSVADPNESEENKQPTEEDDGFRFPDN